jgi:hypothetical protein
MYTVARSSTAIPNTMSSTTRNTAAVPASAASAATNTTAAVVPQRRFPDGVDRPADSKFCKVCYDAGLSIAEYTDHFVKDQPGPNGKVICRTLLHQACRICQRTGHTSSYCPQYRRREEPRREEPRREEPRREERYVEREPRREERYIEREPRRDDRYREEPRRDDRYREEPRRDDRYREEPRRDDRYREEPRRDGRYREEPRRDDRYREEPRRDDRYREERYIEREPRREEPRRGSFNQLCEDTERREREIRERDDAYYREQEEQRRRESTPWLQAVKQPRQSSSVPYAHPHGPRVRLNLEAPALSVAKHGTAFNATPNAEDKEFFVIRGHQYPRTIPGAIDVLAVDLSHSENWDDEKLDETFNPDEMCEAFLRKM